MEKQSLCIVMPLFNEEQAIRRTVSEWLAELRSNEGITFDLLLIDDGSVDDSLRIVKELAADNGEITVWTGPNQGHGKSCLDGYEFAYTKGYDLVLQLDSDGQCDPRYFKAFMDKMRQGGVDSIYGVRYYRKDGLLRYAISRILSVIAFSRSGVWVFDPNVPYRLFRTSTLGSLFDRRSNITLYNVYLAMYHKKYGRVAYLPIVFRDRWGGSPSVKIGGLWRWGLQFWRETRRMNL